MSNVEPVIDNLDDLPDALKKELSKNFLKGSTSLNGFVEKLEPILKSGPKNMDEIILGWYREHNSEIIKRPNTASRLSRALKEGLISQPSAAVYALAGYKPPVKKD